MLHQCIGVMQATYDKPKSHVLVQSSQKVLQITGRICFAGENRRKEIKITHFRSDIINQISTQHHIVGKMSKVAEIAYGWFERIIEPYDAQNAWYADILGPSLLLPVQLKQQLRVHRCVMLV
jgi:hypothetical protein